ncbi:MAG TPA: carboxypeptidase regulatory-like domain-containing protein [Terriglobia bacterium]|nr:carboxypeptidase regulatory-like domain-containing protein [Terriglobia bacterium]
MISMAARRAGPVAAILLVIAGAAWAQGLTVRGRVSLVSARSGKPTADNSQAVVWLNPLDDPRVSWKPGDAGPFRLVQKNKRFIPHILVVPVGAVVEFPNDDPFFHNVFSLFNGKRFDLGLYEAGTTRTVTFNSPGVSYIFCNIHPEMSAVVMATQSPYYALSNAAGSFTITNIPAGWYQLNVWHERCLPETLKAATRDVVVSSSASTLGEIRLPESGNLLANHKNKYGQRYEPVPASTLGY